MSDFPPAGLVGKEDSAQYDHMLEDPSHSSEMEGGYVVSRPRFTRAPRKTFTTGFTFITQSQLTELENFYASKFGGSVSFTWTNPTTQVEHTVRFKMKDGIKADYVGRGGNHHFDVHGIVLEEV